MPPDRNYIPMTQKWWESLPVHPRTSGKGSDRGKKEWEMMPADLGWTWPTCEINEPARVGLIHPLRGFRLSEVGSDEIWCG